MPQFFQENLLNISLIRNEKSKTLELKWKDATSIDVSAIMQVGGGIPLSVRSGHNPYF